MNHAYDIALDPRAGQIVIVGEASAHFAAARLTDNGDLDPTFNTSGTLLDTSFNTGSAYLWAAQAQADGAIVTGGADNAL